MPFVVDASVALAWCFDDEATPYTEAVLERLRETEAVVPAIWPLEVANVLLVAERHRRITEVQALRFIQLLQTLPITVDNEAPIGALGSVLALGRQCGLSAYDASYLELATRRYLPLAIRDTQLSAAADRIGVGLVR